jgi:hypothetical protein
MTFLPSAKMRHCGVSGKARLAAALRRAIEADFAGTRNRCILCRPVAFAEQDSAGQQQKQL